MCPTLIHFYPGTPLYAYRPPKEFLDSVARTKIKLARTQNFVSTVKENLEGFTKRQIDDAIV
jgi:hypothetical protein